MTSYVSSIYVLAQGEMAIAVVLLSTLIAFDSNKQVRACLENTSLITCILLRTNKYNNKQQFDRFSVIYPCKPL